MNIEVENKIIANNKEISRLLSENESLLKGEGYKLPNNNYAVESNSRIQIPSGYIRTSAEFGNNYHLGWMAVAEERLERA